MSTNNFRFKEILVVCPDFNFYHDCEWCGCEKDESGRCSQDGEWESFDDFAYDEYVKDMQNRLEKIGFYSMDKLDGESSYGGRIIAEMDFYHKDEVYKTISVVIRSGYYDGANIDYTVEASGYTDGTKTLDKKIDNKCNRLKKILTKYGGEEYLKVGQFSNGEAVYKKK